MKITAYRTKFPTKDDACWGNAEGDRPAKNLPYAGLFLNREKLANQILEHYSPWFDMPRVDHKSFTISSIPKEFEGFSPYNPNIYLSANVSTENGIRVSTQCYYDFGYNEAEVEKILDNDGVCYKAPLKLKFFKKTTTEVLEQKVDGLPYKAGSTSTATECVGECLVYSYTVWDHSIYYSCSDKHEWYQNYKPHILTHSVYIFEDVTEFIE